jgi:hypothetical protein
MELQAGITGIAIRVVMVFVLMTEQVQAQAQEQVVHAQIQMVVLYQAFEEF